MTRDDLNRYRQQLCESLERLQQDASMVSQQAFGMCSTHSDGGLSNSPSPQNLDDMGTESYLQDLDATLLENEALLAKQALAAIRRIDEGTYGRCENCGRSIIKARLDAIPFTRFCTPCAETQHDGDKS